VEREIEDLAALVDLVGGAAAVFGYSSGAVLALKAAADGVNLTRLALYEPPFVVGDPARERPSGRPEALADLVGAGRPGDAVAMFQIEHLGMPAELVAHVRESPMWPALEAFAPSMVYDAIVTTAYAVPSPAMTAVTTPTLVLSGAATWPGLRAAAVDLADALPAARHLELPGGENHTIPPAPTAAAVREFLR
jgi:hypothetical protein